MKFHNRVHANQYLKFVICIISAVCDANTPCTGTNEDCDLENGLCLCATGFQRNPAVGKEKECIAAPLGLGKL